MAKKLGGRERVPEILACLWCCGGAAASRAAQQATTASRTAVALAPIGVAPLLRSSWQAPTLLRPDLRSPAQIETPEWRTPPLGAVGVSWSGNWGPVCYCSLAISRPLSLVVPLRLYRSLSARGGLSLSRQGSGGGGGAAEERSGLVKRQGESVNVARAGGKYTSRGSGRLVAPNRRLEQTHAGLESLESRGVVDKKRNRGARALAGVA